MSFKLGIYRVAKLKPVLENKYQSKMGFKLGIYWVASKATILKNKFGPMSFIELKYNIFVYN